PMFRSLINLFFPEVCAGCDNLLLATENVICTRCRHNIPMTNHHLLLKNEAYYKFYGKLPVEFVATMCYFHKRGIVQEMIHKLKYKSCEEIGAALGSWYAHDLAKIKAIHTIDEILPVPLHRKRLRQRGYNQVATFAKALSEDLGLDHIDTLLVRKVYSKTQPRKSRGGRSSSSQSVFDVEFSENAHGKHFMIVDDVLTTGATLEACGRAILKIP